MKQHAVSFFFDVRWYNRIGFKNVNHKIAASDTVAASLSVSTCDVNFTSTLKTTAHQYKIISSKCHADF